MKNVDSMTGVPQEFRSTVEKVLLTEPDHKVNLDISRINYQAQSFTLKKLLLEHKWRMAIAFLIVFSLAFTQNIGPIIFSKAIDVGVIEKDLGALLLYVAIYFLIAVLSVFFSCLNISYTGSLGQHILYKVRVDVFRHLQSLSLDYYTRTKAGQIIARMTTDINSLSRMLNKVLVNLAVQFLALLIIITIMVWMNIWLAFIVVLTVFPPMILATMWFRRESTIRFSKARDCKANLMADLRESLHGIKQVIGFNRQTSNIARHDDGIDTYLTANRKTAEITSLYPAIAAVVEVIAQVVLFYMGYQLIVEGGLTVGELIAYSLFIRRFFGPIEQMSILFGSLQEGRVAASKIAQLMAIAPSVSEIDNPLEADNVVGRIRFENVYFSYKNDGDSVLRNLSLTINSGETVAIVGETGAGKSTIVKLINRLYDPLSGSVTIDDVDVGDMRIESLRSQVGVIQQNPFLFDGSIRDNIALAKPDATEQEILEACERACLSEFIERLPEGLHTLCQDEGACFSAGEKQLIIIARLFLSVPAIVLFDEATSNIDQQTEMKIEQALSLLMRDRTAVIVSHRLQNTRFVDRIFVISDGQVLQSGRFEELVNEKGIFREMLDSQP
jgi:ATP-binding cassette subfamily B protein